MVDLIRGLDVSSVQGTVDWASVAQAGYQFAFCKCYTGNDGLDPTYATNIAGAQAAGLQVGTYNFLYPLQTTAGHANRDPESQAQLHFSNTTTPLVAVDLEWPAPQDWAKWGVNPDFIVNWTLAYLTKYTALSGTSPIIYSYPFFLEALSSATNLAQLSNYKLWIASYEPSPVVPSPFSEWVCWQTSGGTEKLPNGTPIDCNAVKNLIDLWPQAT